MRDLLTSVIVAPMAGGPTTVELVIGAGRAGAVGFLAAGYKSAAAVEDELRKVGAAGTPYGMNIFLTPAPPPDIEPLERYRKILQGEADRYEVDLPALRLDDDDHLAAKVELAVAYRPPLVSFTFGTPPADAVEALHAAGSSVLVTVTSADEARRAVAAGADGLIAQGGTAGGHSSTTAPEDYRGTASASEILAQVRGTTGLPVIAAGGTGSAADVALLLGEGAAAVQCGTAFLLADEAGTREAQRAVMLDGTARSTVVTRAFTGQPARGLRNRFTDAYSDLAPIGYPAVHHLTAPIRAAAARRGDAGALNLWAGTGFDAARPAPIADLIEELLPA